MEFDRPVLVEDTITYRIFTQTSSSSSNTKDDTTKFLSHLQHSTQDHVWHQQGFNLQKEDNEDSFYEGKSIVGECIDDEWVILYALWSLSKEHVDVVIQVEDRDGDSLPFETSST